MTPIKEEEEKSEIESQTSTASSPKEIPTPPTSKPRTLKKEASVINIPKFKKEFLQAYQDTPIGIAKQVRTEIRAKSKGDNKAICLRKISPHINMSFREMDYGVGNISFAVSEVPEAIEIRLIWKIVGFEINGLEAHMAIWDVKVRWNAYNTSGSQLVDQAHLPLNIIHNIDESTAEYIECDMSLQKDINSGWYIIENLRRK